MQKSAKTLVVVVMFLALAVVLALVYLETNPENVARRQVAQLEEKWKSQKYFDLTADPCAALKLRDMYEAEFKPHFGSTLLDEVTRRRLGDDDAYYAHQYSDAVLKAKRAGKKIECDGRPEYELIAEAWGPMIHHYSDADIAFIRGEYIQAVRGAIDQLIDMAERTGAISREELGR
jgi:hypothetical protein